LAFFGAPITHENDAERAILAALDIREGVKELDLDVSIGIDTGMTYVGEMGSDLVYSERSAWGPDVDFAKRLQEAATPGQIWVGASTYRLVIKAFDFADPVNFQAKGMEGTAYPVLSVKERPEKLRGIEGLRARMIGREHEFADLKEAADAWLGGQGQIVGVIGKAGIGDFCERIKIVRRMKRGKHQAMSEGRYVGGYLAYGYTYDYETKKLQVDEEQAEVVKLIFRLCVEDNMSTRKIAEELTVRGIPTHVEVTGHTYLKLNPSVEGWYSGSVRGILTNPIYKGTNRYDYHGVKNRLKPREEWKFGTCPAIVSEELWELAQVRLRDRRIMSRKNKKYEYLLSNLLYCRERESKMQGITYSYKGKPAYPYYRCNGRAIKTLGLNCDMPSVKRKPIEALVWEKITEIVTNPELIQVSLTNFEPSTTEDDLAKLAQKLKNKEMEQERLVSAYRKGIIEIDDLERQMGQIKSEIEAIDERRRELEDMLATSAYETQITEKLYDRMGEIQKRIENCSFGDKQEITRLIVRRV
jgi:site-specific DNA recombinase